jgi:hypothetical protein
MKTTLTSQESRNLRNNNYDLTNEIKNVKRKLIEMNITDEVILKVIGIEIQKIERKIKANNIILSKYPTILEM